MAKRFDKVNVEISNICNLQCSFCPEVQRKKLMMTPELFTRVIEQVAPVTEQVTFHLMGDPLVHPELPALLDICQAHGTRVFFVTNGVLLNEASQRLLLHPALRQVNFSLHSFHDNFGDKDASVYLGRIFTYTEMAFAERPDLYLNYRIWNLQEPRGGTSHQADILAAVEKRFEITVNRNPDVRHHKGYRVKNRLYLHYDTEFVWPDLNLPELGKEGSCYGLSNHIGVLADGTVVPCCLDKEGKIPLGNLTENSLTEILESPRARAMKLGFQAGKLVEPLCQRCQYITRFVRPAPGR